MRACVFDESAQRLMQADPPPQIIMNAVKLEVPPKHVTVIHYLRLALNFFS